MYLLILAFCELLLLWLVFLDDFQCKEFALKIDMMNFEFWIVHPSIVT